MDILNLESEYIISLPQISAIFETATVLRKFFFFWQDASHVVSMFPVSPIDYSGGLSEHQRTSEIAQKCQKKPFSCNYVFYIFLNWKAKHKQLHLLNLAPNFSLVFFSYQVFLHCSCKNNLHCPCLTVRCALTPNQQKLFVPLNPSFNANVLLHVVL